MTRFLVTERFLLFCQAFKLIFYFLSFHFRVVIVINVMCFFLVKREKLFWKNTHIRERVELKNNLLNPPPKWFSEKLENNAYCETTDFYCNFLLILAFLNRTFSLLAVFTFIHIWMWDRKENKVKNNFHNFSLFVMLGDYWLIMDFWTKRYKKIDSLWRRQCFKVIVFEWG